ncbi:regulator of G protein signaling domain-containing protein [Gigaspora rosea]|uniref:Regulator of G protein signaling domain-containing protein n=1 Tax=Gigaspora rosea TaxID=44941 RepID=A0A397UCW9_9GLOM|nr:regulator of G protein signaling domain-containing protein [Gigaspora rosea]
MASSQPQVHQQSSTHMMKTTRSGRPFVKDIHDLYSTLVVSLPMESHRYLFRSYSNSFTTEEAIANLGSLKFTQSHRTPDPKDPSRIITTTTTTTFSMTKEMAKSVCQTFMDSKLFVNLADSNSRSFKDRNVYGLTPKGLYILERFVARNGITAPHLTKLFASQTSSIKLYYIERSMDNDSIVLNKQNIESIFRKFVGDKPNDVTNYDIDYTSDSASGSSTERGDRSLGIELKDRLFNHRMYRQTFSGVAAVEWLCDFTTLITKEEAMKVSTEFIRYDLIECVSEKISDDKRKPDKIIAFRYSKSTYYQITNYGRQIALWDYDVHNNYNTNQLYSGNSNTLKNGKSKSIPNLSHHNTNDSNTNGQIDKPLPNLSESHKPHRNSTNDKDGHNFSIPKESNTKKLQQILDDPFLCSLFMEFLKAKFCEENLLFYLEVQDFKLKYNISINEDSEILDPNKQTDLIKDAFRIYSTYLAPHSPQEVNLEHNLRQDMIQYMSMIVPDPQSPGFDEKSSNKITGRLYDKIQDTIFRLMATDSVPKFIKTEKYLTSASIRRADNGDSNSIGSHRHNPSSSSGESQETKSL